MALPALPDELLLAICHLVGHAAPREIPSLRLVCRRLRDVAAHLLLSRTTVDLSRPETLDRLCAIADDAGIAAGVREVNVRLHFYHPWIAAGLDHFTAAVTSEWTQRRRRWSPGGHRTAGQRELSFPDIVGRFLDELDHGAPSSSSGRVLRAAFQAYRSRWAAQDAAMLDGRFPRVLAAAFSKLPNANHLRLYDGELTNNFDPGTRVRVDAGDQPAQDRALIDVLSRPMLWEDASWLEPAEQIWPGVPVDLLCRIPMEIGRREGVVLDQLSVDVSSAPDYTVLAAIPELVDQLSVAADAMSLFMVAFQPRCRSGCGPWAVDDAGSPVYVVRSADEVRAVNRYLGALVNTKSMYQVEINLGEFWFSAGMESLHHAPASLGVDFPWPEGSELTCVSLHEVSLEVVDLEHLAQSLCRGATVELVLIFVREGTWSAALDCLREKLKAPEDIKIRHPLGGGVDDLDGESLSFVFGIEYDSSSSCGGHSRAERFAKGENLSNPFLLRG